MALSGLPNILHDIQSRTSWQQRCQYLLIVEKWSKIVGDSVAKQTCPLGVYQKVLQVAVSSSVWSQALTFERVRILAKLNAMLGEVNGGVNTLAIADIHFSTAKWATHQQTLEEKKVISEDHPSYLPALLPTLGHDANHNKFKTTDRTKKSSELIPPPETAAEAFQRWQAVMKLRAVQMPKCPQCDRPSLTGEISRWQMCRVCAIVHLFN